MLGKGSKRKTKRFSWEPFCYAFGKIPQPKLRCSPLSSATSFPLAKTLLKRQTSLTTDICSLAFYSFPMRFVACDVQVWMIRKRNHHQQKSISHHGTPSDSYLRILSSDQIFVLRSSLRSDTFAARSFLLSLPVRRAAWKGTFPLLATWFFANIFNTKRFRLEVQIQRKT